MFTRKRWTWRVRLSSASGQTLNKTIRNYWSPKRSETSAYIANCAAAMEAARIKEAVFPTAEPELVEA